MFKERVAEKAELVKFNGNKTQWPKNENTIVHMQGFRLGYLSLWYL